MNWMMEQMVKGQGLGDLPGWWGMMNPPATACLSGLATELGCWMALLLMLDGACFMDYMDQ